jgi:hypothetical protein
VHIKIARSTRRAAASSSRSMLLRSVVSLTCITFLAGTCSGSEPSGAEEGRPVPFVLEAA